MTERKALYWIKDNLGPAIQQALASFPGVIYTEDWLASMSYREIGHLIHRYDGKPVKTIAPLIKGDYANGEPNGFGFWQIDRRSYPAFVKSGGWMNPLKCCMQAIEVLEEKRIYLQKQFPNLAGEALKRAITAAYNCGQGNVTKALKSGKDVDAFTFKSDYSKEVWRFREIYKSLQSC